MFLSPPSVLTTRSTSLLFLGPTPLFGTRQALGKLKPRQVDVLTLRFGLGGHEPKTLEEVGAIYGVTREPIRQIESAALKELAKGNSGKLLRQFL